MNRKIVSTSGVSIIFFFSLIAFSYQSCVSPRDRSIREWEKYEWKIVKADKSEEPTWIIYSRKVTGTDFIEYKIEGDIAATPQACLSSFKQNIYYQADDSENKKYPTYEIMDESENTLLTYMIHDELFPFRNTEMSVRYFFSQDPESSTKKVTWREAWEEESVPPPTKKLSRVQTFRGSWHFSPVASNRSQAVNTVQVDPKKMPQWFVNKMVVKFLVEGLENIRAMTAEL
jgi:hypothetical protein